MTRELADFARFLAHQSHFLRQHPGLLHQQAWNAAGRLDVRAAAERRVRAGRSIRGPWLRKTAGVERQTHRGEVLALAFRPDGRGLVASTGARQVWEWDVGAGDVLQRCEAPASAARALAYSPDGRLLAGGYGWREPSPFVSGVQVWTAGGAAHSTFRVLDWVWSVRWHDADTLIAGAGMPQGAETGGTVWLASASTGECHSLPFLSDSPVVCTWAGPGDEEVVLTRDGRVRLVPRDASNGEVVEIDRRGFTLPSSVRAARIAGGGRVAVLTDAGVFLAGVEAARGRHALQGARVAAEVEGPTSLAVLPSGDALAVGTQAGEVWIAPVSGGAATRILAGSAPVTALAASPDGGLLAAGTARGGVVVCRIAGGATVFEAGTDEPLEAVRIEPRRVLRLRSDRVLVTPLAGDGGTREVPISGLDPIDFDARGDLAVVLGVPASATTPAELALDVVHLGEARSLARLRVPAAAAALAPAETLMQPCVIGGVRLSARSDGVDVLLASGQGVMAHPLLTTGRGRPLVVACPAAPGVLARDVPALACATFAVSDDQRALAVSYRDRSRGHEINARGEVRVWDPGAGTSSPPIAFPSAVGALAASASTVIAGSSDGTASAWLWDGEWRGLAGVRAGHAVAAVACSHGGQLACAVSSDGLLTVWRPDTGEAMLRTFVDVPPRAVAFVGDDRSVCLVDSSGEIHVWEIAGVEPPPPAAGPEAPRLDAYLAAAGTVGRIVDRLSAGDFAGATAAISELDTSAHLQPIRDDWLARIALESARARLEEPVQTLLARVQAGCTTAIVDPSDYTAERSALEALKALAGEVSRMLEAGRLDDALAVRDAIPELAPNLVQRAVRRWDETLRVAAARRRVEPVIARVRELVGRGRFDEARAAVDGITADSPEVSDIVQALRGQLDELASRQQDQGDERRQIAEALATLGAIGIDRGRLEALARQHGVDAADPLAFHGFLKAVLDQLPPWLRPGARKAAPAGRRRWWRFWR